MTQILNLPLLSFPMTVGTNEDWLDSWAYLDSSGNPLSLAGLTAAFMVRRSASDASVVASASTAAPTSTVVPSGTVTLGGAGGNVLALNFARSTMLKVAPGSYVFEAQATGDGVTRTIASGQLTVVQGVVR